MARRDVIAFDTIIVGCVQQGHGELALEVFSEMHKACIRGNHFTFFSILSACTSVATTLEYGRQVHAHVIMARFESNYFVSIGLLTMYADCGSIEVARKILDEMPKIDLVSYNFMITGCVQYGLNWEAMKVFCWMRWAGIGGDEFTFSSVLTVCASLMAEEQGKGIHANIVKTRFKSNVFGGSALLDMYGTCGYVEDASRVFD